MRDNSAPKAARYMTEVTCEDGIPERILDFASFQWQMRDEGCTVWVYHKTLTDMIAFFQDLARGGAVHAFAHRRKDVPCDCGSTSAVWWEYAWWD